MFARLFGALSGTIVVLLLVLLVLTAFIVAAMMHKKAMLGSRSGGGQETTREPLYRRLDKEYSSTLCRRIDNFMITKICHSRKAGDNFWEALHHSSSDVQFLELLSRNCKPHVPKEPGFAQRANPTPESKGRTESRLHDIEKFIAPYRAQENVNYLDVGTSEGAITNEFVEYLHLPKERAFGIDIIEQKSPSTLFTSKAYDGVNLPWKEEKFDIVTMFMSAHHFEKPDELFAAVYNAMKPGAILIMREHDVRSAEMSLFLDVVHAVYAVVVNKETTAEQFAKDVVEGKVSHYRSLKGWMELCQKTGFVEVYGEKKTDRFDSCYVVCKKPQAKKIEADIRSAEAS